MPAPAYHAFGGARYRFLCYSFPLFGRFSDGAGALWTRRLRAAAHDYHAGPSPPRARYFSWLPTSRFLLFMVFQRCRCRDFEFWRRYDAVLFRPCLMRRYMMMDWPIAAVELYRPTATRTDIIATTLSLMMRCALSSADGSRCRRTCHNTSAAIIESRAEFAGPEPLGMLCALGEGAAGSERYMP